MQRIEEWLQVVLGHKQSKKDYVEEKTNCIYPDEKKTLRIRPLSVMPVHVRNLTDLADLHRPLPLNVFEMQPC